MKSEQDTFFSQQNLFSIPPSIQKSKNLSSKHLFNFPIQCPFQKQAFEYCCEESCFQNAVICQDENCKCQMAHEDCENFIKINRFHNKINSKIVANNEKMTKEIEDNVHKIIDLLSDMLQKITESMKIFGLNKGQRQIIRVIRSQFDQNLNQNEREIITGQTLFKYRSQQKLHQQSWYEQSLSHFKKIISKTKISIEPIFNQLQITITHIHIENSPQQPPQKFLLQSKILSLHDQLNAKGNNQSSIGFLVNCLKQSMINIGSIKKLYSYQKQCTTQINNQGSRNKNRGNPYSIFSVIPKNNSQQSIQTFNIKDFAKICQLKENLLFVVRNSHGVRFGAFTPCKFNSTLNQWASDAFKKSFIFSLNCQQVQKLTNISQGLRFIGNEIQIGRDPCNASQNGFTVTLGQHDVLSQIEFEKQPIIANPSPNVFPVKINPTYIQANGAEKDPKKVGFSVVELEVYQILLKRFSISQPMSKSKIEQKNIFQKSQPPKKNIFNKSLGAESQNFIINSPNGGLFQTTTNSFVVGFPTTGSNIFSKNTQFGGMLQPRK